MAMISAERIRSVRIAPFTCSASRSARIGHGVGQLLLVIVVVEQDFGDLLGRFEGEVGAADHQQRHDQERREGGQEERRGKQEQQFVLQRAERDLADDRKLALRREARRRNAASRLYRR